MSARNRGVAGRVVDERGAPLAGLVVRGFDEDLARAPDALGEARTGADGAFSLAYSPSAYGPLEARPDVLLRVLDPVGIRVLASSGVFRDVEEETLRVPDLVVRRASLAGWAATLHGDAPSRISRGNAVELLADDEQFDALTNAIDRARETVHLLQFLWEPGFRARFRLGGLRRGTLAEDLVDAARRGARVRVMVNENAVVPDDVDEIRRALRPAGDRAEVLGFPISPTVMHAKVLVVDDEEAFVIGPIFMQKSWDTTAHHGDDPRRGTDRPTHDVSVRLRGPAVRDVAEVFALHWNEIARRRSVEAVALAPAAGSAAGPAAGALAAQVVRTLPRLVFREEPNGETGILESYERALALAERFVYLENQYFTSETIVRALHRLLVAKPALEIVVLANDLVDVPFYNRWQRRNVASLRYPEHPRLGFFVLAEPTPGDPSRPAAPIYVHSKLGMVDDCWMTVGTANLDDVSLEPSGALGVRVESNVDVNVNVFDGVDGHAATGAVRDARQRLWAEHLGLAKSALAEPPADGWLATWRAIAESNARALLEARPRDFRGRVLPFVPERPLTRGLTKTGPG